MRYYFNIVNATSAYKDNSGKHFSSDQHATEHATMVAREYAWKGGWDGWSVQAVDEHGAETARVQISSPK